MTDDEFNVLDELYFVQDYEEVKSQCDYDSLYLDTILRSLYDKGWIKILSDVDTEVSPDDIDGFQLSKCYFLATKNGLLAHNSS